MEVKSVDSSFKGDRSLAGVRPRQHRVPFGCIIMPPCPLTHAGLHSNKALGHAKTPHMCNVVTAAAVGGRGSRRPGRQQQQVGPPEGIRRADDGAGISIKCRVWGSTSSWQQGVQCAGPGKGAGPSIA